MRRTLQLLGPFLAVLVFIAMPARGEAPRIELTDTEKTWIKEHPVVYFGYDPGWGPFSYKDTRGDFAGIDRDFLKLLEERLGLKFQPVHSSSWPEAYNSAKAGAVDFLVSTAEDEGREQDFVFTRAYNSFPMAFVTRHDSRAVMSMDQLNGRRMALPEGYVGSLVLARDHPRIVRVMVKTMDEAFLAVAAGRADVAVTNIANANYIIKSLGLSNLKIAGVMPYLFDLRYAVRKDQPVLRDILDKGVASLSAKDRQEIVGPWVGVEYARIVRWDYVMRWVAGGFVVAGTFIGVMIWHNRCLRRELAQRARVQRELEATQRRLEELNEEKTGLMRMAAHDLRNPLNGLMLNIEILSDAAVEKDREPLDRMMGLAHQMIHMIRNLLDVQALEDGKRRLRIEPVEVTKEVDDVLAAMQTLAARKQITFTTDFARTAPLALADRAALRQVLNNLVGNAVKYSPFDRVVAVEVEPALQGRLVFRVRDQGPGIAPAEMPRLFQKYVCLSARPTGGEQSIGLGLAIVKQLVIAMGGTVRCEESPGGGAVFIVELPAVVGVAV
ncbi:ATP-binding protein [Rariglobus hedericola]|uniref:histidine kinase n=1 Tax=Rariglobus hedericola TaxID=2597822 RepID=A0A556QGK8_9BACT|nr:transporter substrate-binding domain-containing protein [Rariglobus hedericola]TSJ75751.1 transporter substrate-binding domain-containing protein [Rariglobus hedericola]